MPTSWMSLHKVEAKILRALEPLEPDERGEVLLRVNKIVSGREWQEKQPEPQS